MDIATLIGLGGSFALIMIGIVLGGSPITGFIDPPSFVIVIGGTAMSLFVAYPMKKVTAMVPVIKNLFFAKDHDVIGIINQLIELCAVVRREGLLALDAALATVDDPFLARGAQFVVDGTDPEMTRLVLEAEIAEKESRHAAGRGMMEFMGASAPAFGMIGTLIGLVSMLANLDPATLGPKMAVALLTTFYGSVLANCVFNPGAKKMAAASAAEILVNTIMVEGLLGIQAGENPRNLEEKLKAYLPISMRNGIGEGDSAAQEAA